LFAFNKYVLPLFEALIENGQIKETPKFLGMSFNINKSGAIATCSHLFSNLDKSKMVIGIEMGNYDVFTVQDIKCHDKYDFAIATAIRRIEAVLPLMPTEEYLAGVDVMAYGVNTDGLNGQKLQLCPRLMKGHIVRIGNNSQLKHARSICEISFPSLAGFSGTPIVSSGPQQYVAGMLYGNYESSIELFKITEIDDSHSKYNEQIHRVYEFGLAHTPADIKLFLKDLDFEI
jgi:hypothetical protein